MADRSLRKKKMHVIIETRLDQRQSESVFRFATKNSDRSFLKRMEAYARVVEKYSLNFSQSITLTAMDIFTGRHLAATSTGILSNTDFQKTISDCSVSTVTIPEDFMDFARISHMIFKNTASVVHEQSRKVFRRLAEKKGSPRIDYETVVCTVKDGSAHQGGSE